MMGLWKFFLLQVLTCHCTIYYDDEIWEEEEYVKHKEDSAVNDFNLELLISGGYRPEKEPHTKYLASIRTNNPTEFFGDNHYCTGTLIGLNMVVTAAHCLNTGRIVTRARRIKVVLGTPNRLQRSIYTLIRAVSSVFIHPGFKHNARHDIALLLLKLSIPFNNPNIEIISLARVKPPPSTKCTTLGYGQLLYMGPYAAEAVYLDLEILDPAECYKYYGKNFDERYSLCVSSWDRQKTTCRGDSGGPLICDGYIAGVLSVGMFSGNEYRPNVFTCIKSHYEWIDYIKNSQAQFVGFSLLIYINVFVVNLF